jgi:hypothetical protein
MGLKIECGRTVLAFRISLPPVAGNPAVMAKAGILLIKMLFNIKFINFTF